MFLNLCRAWHFVGTLQMFLVLNDIKKKKKKRHPEIEQYTLLLVFKLNYHNPLVGCVINLVDQGQYFF